MPVSTTYTIQVSRQKQNIHGAYIEPLWRWKISCGDNILFTGETHSEASAYIFAGAAFSRISGEMTEVEITTHALSASN